MRLKLTIAYDGAPFTGWQRQACGDTIQHRLEGAITRITNQPVTVYAAGRTDAGVHALGQIAHFDVPPEFANRLPPTAWQRAMNAVLPPEIRILCVRAVPDDFHARFSARRKVYRYEIRTTPVLPPHLHRRAWHLPQPLDLDLLRHVLGLYQGCHDFRPLAANRGTPIANTVREIYEVRLAVSSQGLRITYVGAGFLYKMIRILTASAVRVARGRDPLSWLENLLADPSAVKSRHVAPPGGLTLVRVQF